MITNYQPQDGGFAKRIASKLVASKKSAQYEEADPLVPVPSHTADFNGDLRSLAGSTYRNSGDNSYGDDDDSYSVAFGSDELELLKDGRVVETYDYPEEGHSSPPSGYELAEDEDPDNVPDYVYNGGEYLEFVKDGSILWTLHMDDFIETEQSTRENA